MYMEGEEEQNEELGSGEVQVKHPYVSSAGQINQSRRRLAHGDNN